MSFLTTLASRLLTDFTRRKFGHIRMPQWLSDKKDPLWSVAYQLLMTERYRRHEAVNMLEMNQPWREHWFLEEIVSTVLARCQRPCAHASEASVSIENCAEPGSTDSTPETKLSIDNSELMDAFCLLLGLHDKIIATSTQRIRELALRLKPHVNLTEKDRRLLRLRLVDGIKMKDIALQLSLAESPYRRYHKILRSLRNSCRQAGLWDEVWIE